MFWTKLPLGWPQKKPFFKPKMCWLWFRIFFLNRHPWLIHISTFSPLNFFDLRALSVRKVMLFWQIGTFLHFFGHPGLSGSLQVGLKFSDPKLLQISYLFCFRKSQKSPPPLLGSLRVKLDILFLHSYELSSFLLYLKNILFYNYIFLLTKHAIALKLNIMDTLGILYGINS